MGHKRSDTDRRLNIAMGDPHSMYIGQSFKNLKGNLLCSCFSDRFLLDILLQVPLCEEFEG